MKKNTLLKIVNPLIALLLLCQVCTALLMLLMGHGAVGEIHEVGGILLALGIILHLILNLNWVKANYLKKWDQIRDSRN